MIRVCMTVAGLGKNLGGPSRSVTQICDYLALEGLEVHLVYGSGCDSEGAPILPQNPSVKSKACRSVCLLGTRRRYYPGFDGVLTKFCREKGIQIIHDNGVWLGSNHAAANVAKRLDIPLVLTPRGMLTPWAMGHKGLKKRAAWWLYQRAICRQAKLLHATSKQEAQDLRSLGLTNPIAVIPNGVEIPKRWPRPAKVFKGRRRMLFLSRIHPKKGVIELLRSLARHKALAQKTHWLLSVAGNAEGGHMAVCQAEAARLGLDKLVEWLGPVEGQAKWALYRSAQVFVLPTYSENFGIVVAEALAAGVPVLTTQGAPWRELITRHCGWWIPTGQQALDKALPEVLGTSPARLKTMGARGIGLVHAKYDWTAIGRHLVQTYNWLLGQGSKPVFVMKGLSK